MFFTTGLKITLTASLTAMLLVLVCTSSHAAELSTQDLQAQYASDDQMNNAEQTLSQTLIISAPGAVWVKDEHPLITLTEGSLIVIAGKQPVNIKTIAGNVYIPAGLAAMVQQESNCPVRISMIGVRGKVADADRNEWAVTVNANDDSSYKLAFGEVLLSSPGDGYSDTSVIQQSLATRELIREAAHQLNSIALALNVHGVLLADKIANDCASVLLSVAQGNKISAADQLQHPVRIFVDDGTKFLAVQPGSVYVPTTYSPTASTGMLATRK
jgi:hypothetical protein